MSDEKPSANLCGCIVVAWSLFITVPMWLVMTFGILSAIEAPSWVWIVYWIYVPVSFVGAVFSGLFKLILNAE